MDFFFFLDLLGAFQFGLFLSFIRFGIAVLAFFVYMLLLVCLRDGFVHYDVLDLCMDGIG